MIHHNYFNDYKGNKEWLSFFLEAKFKKNKSQGSHINGIRTALLDITELYYNILYWRMKLFPAGNVFSV